MKPFALLIAAAAIAVAVAPALAVAQGGPAQAGAVAYCAARSNGASPDNANRAAVRAIYSEVGMVDFVVRKRELGSQMWYLAGRMCPGQ